MNDLFERWLKAVTIIIIICLIGIIGLTAFITKSCVMKNIQKTDVRK